MRNRGTSIDASAGFHRVQSRWPPRYPTAEAIPAIALGATDSQRFLVIVSKSEQGKGNDAGEQNRFGRAEIRGWNQ